MATQRQGVANHRDAKTVLKKVMGSKTAQMIHNVYTVKSSM